MKRFSHISWITEKNPQNFYKIFVIDSFFTYKEWKLGRVILKKFMNRLRSFQIYAGPTGLVSGPNLFRS